MSTFETVIRDQVEVNQRIEHAAQRIRAKLLEAGVPEFCIRVDHDLMANPARLVFVVRDCARVVPGVRLDLEANITSPQAMIALSKDAFFSAFADELVEIATLWRSTTSPLEVL